MKDFKSVSKKSINEKIRLGKIIYDKMLEGYTNQMLTDELGVSINNIDVLLTQFLRKKNSNQKFFYKEIIKNLEIRLCTEHSDKLMDIMFYNTNIYLNL